MSVSRFPLLPLRDVVLFPGAPSTLIVGRPRSVGAVRAALQGGRMLVVVAQRNGEVVRPALDDLYGVGTLVHVAQAIDLPDGNVRLLLEGRRRVQIEGCLDKPDHTLVEILPLKPGAADDPEVDALARSVKATVERYVKLNRAAPPEMLMGVNAIEDPSKLADLLVGVLKLTFEERQELLEMVEVRARLERVYRALQNEIEFLQVERKLRHRVQREKQTTERGAWIDEQVRAIQKEMNEPREGADELEELRQQLADKQLTEAARERAERELKRLGQMNPMSAEATVVRNYLDWLVALPWTASAPLVRELGVAQAILEEEHHGLEEVKERIVEYLAVSTLSEEAQGPILCLVGPPGVGKTSLARSIARATGRPFARIALGGVRDEAEIRGHRRTYIGALPGRIVQAMKRAGAVNPLLLLDEVDKMSSDIRGDPSSALLEVLDPEQNATFADHYLDLDYDLSKVMFLCTANSLRGIPLPLRDRLEVIELGGYTETERLAIAERYLIPKQRRRSGLAEGQLELLPDARRALVAQYTKEAGVRALEREIGRVCRKVARRVVEEGPETTLRLDEEALRDLLGPPPHDLHRREDDDAVGLVQGLSVGPTGGQVIHVEVAAVPGKGKLETTGQLGEVLKESAKAVFTYVRSRAAALGVEPDFHETQDFHIHYPGLPGGVEGPSAGIAMAVALVSALTGIPVRSDTAMTGELTLRGRVLPIGGVKDKILAAHRAGITRVLIPEKNRKDLHKVPGAILAELEVIAVAHMDRVLQDSLTDPPLARGLSALGPGLDPAPAASADDAGGAGLVEEAGSTPTVDESEKKGPARA